MGAIGDLQSFTMYQAANSMAKIAEQQGGQGANAMGMGMGAGFGMMLPGMIQQSMLAQQQRAVAGTPPTAQTSTAAPVVATLAGTAPAGVLNFDQLAPAVKDPRPIVRSVIQSSGWQVQESANQWTVTIPIGSLRKQNVTITFGEKDPEGHEIVRYISICGPSTPESALVLLKYNTQMVFGSFAVQSSPSGDIVVVQANQLAGTTNALDVSRIVTSIAWQADKVEEKLLGGGDHS
jgi:hypothetical protein